MQPRQHDKLEDELGALVHPQAARTSGSSGLVSIVLSGAELAALDLSHLQLFWASSSASQGGNETRIELRRKSGMAVESPVIVPASIFELSNGSSRIDEEGCCRDDSFAASDSAEEQQPGKLRLFDSESSAAVSPIVLKSRAVIEAEKHRQQQPPPPPQERETQAGWRRKTKKRAVSMDEASLGLVQQQRSVIKKQSSSSKDDLNAILQRRREISSKAPSSARLSKKSEPMPLPLPPLEIPRQNPVFAAQNGPDEQRQGEQKREERSEFGRRQGQQQHRRHLSIDLRASPAAKFLVKVMPWEVPRSPSPLSTAAEGTPQSCFVPFKWEEAPGKPKLRKDGERFFRHHNVDHQPPLRLPPRLQADLSHGAHKHQHHNNSLWHSILLPTSNGRGQKTSSTAIAIASAAAAAASSPTSILDAAATESTPSSCAASVSSPNAADETIARGKCSGASKDGHHQDGDGGFCVIAPSKELAPEVQQRDGNENSSSIQGKLRAFFAWQVWQRLVLGKKKGNANATRSDRQQEQQQKQQQQCESYDNFDELMQRNNKRRKRKKGRNRIRAPADYSSKNQDYPLRSPSPMVFSWFASPLQIRQRENIGQRAFTRIAASCNVLKKVVLFKRLRWRHHRRRMHWKPSSRTKSKSIYRPLLCRVDADSAAFACSSSTM